MISKLEIFLCITINPSFFTCNCSNVYTLPFCFWTKTDRFSFIQMIDYGVSLDVYFRQFEKFLFITKDASFFTCSCSVVYTLLFCSWTKTECFSVQVLETFVDRKVRLAHQCIWLSGRERDVYLIGPFSYTLLLKYNLLLLSFG